MSALSKIPLPVKLALLGAVLFDLMIVAANIAYDVWAYHKPASFAKDLVSKIGMLLALPAALFSNEHSMASPYVVNGVLGALIFGAIGGFWQLLRSEKR